MSSLCDVVQRGVRTFVTMALLQYPIATASATLTTQTGIGSPAPGESLPSIERLRNRAISNAMELALQQVSGTMMSTEQSDYLSSRETIESVDGESTEQLHQDARFRSAALARTEGFVRISEILDEWREGDSYYVKVELEVLDAQEATSMTDAGYYWVRAGKPGISIEYREIRADTEVALGNSEMLEYIRANFIDNAIEPSLQESGATRYRVVVTQDVETRAVPNFGTLASRCRLSARVLDLETNRVLKEHRESFGPQAGFTQDAAERQCIGAIAPKLSAALIRSLIEIMNEISTAGGEFQVRIDNLPSAEVGPSVEAIERAFRVNSARLVGFEDGVLDIAVQFKGQSPDLIESLTSSLGERGQQIVLRSASSSSIGFRWTGLLNN